jgi:hypothetical protein
MPEALSEARLGDLGLPVRAAQKHLTVFFTISIDNQPI